MKETGLKEFKESAAGTFLLGLGFLGAFWMNTANAGVSQSSSLRVSGNLNELVSISFKTNKDTAFDLFSFKKEFQVASVYEVSNSSDGYVVKARSENNGRFLSADGKESIPYDLKYGEGAAVSLTSDNQTVSSKNSKSALVQAENFISISLRKVPLNFSAQNAYQDFITFTIESR